MGREVKRVPMDFDFPIGESFADAHWVKHEATCDKEDHDDCDSYFGDDIPTGDGWQLWQTVSDGPISPVFATADELIDWMCQPVPVDQQRRGFLYRDEDPAYPSMPWAQGWRRNVAEPFVREHGWAPSMVVSDGEVMSGVQFVVGKPQP